MEKIKLIDILIALAVVIAIGVGFFTYKHFRQTAGKQIKSTQKIVFQVFMRGVTLTGPESPIKPKDTTFISIRNVPYTNLNIVDVTINPEKTVIPDPGSKGKAIVVNDPSKEFSYDVLVTLVDEAKITKDGAVVGGNKIKMGLPITLEGIDYKFNGTVSNIRLLVSNPPAGNQNAAQKAQSQPKIEYKKTETQPAAKK